MSPRDLDRSLIANGCEMFLIGVIGDGSILTLGDLLGGGNGGGSLALDLDRDLSLMALAGVCERALISCGGLLGVGKGAVEPPGGIVVN